VAGAPGITLRWFRDSFYGAELRGAAAADRSAYDIMTDEARRELRDRLLQTIIENRIQLQQAEREKITAEDSEVQDQVNDIMKKVNAPSADFDRCCAPRAHLDGLKAHRDQILVSGSRAGRPLRREQDRRVQRPTAASSRPASRSGRHIYSCPSRPGKTAGRGAQKAEQVCLGWGQDAGLRGVLGDRFGKDGGSLERSSASCPRSGKPSPSRPGRRRRHGRQSAVHLDGRRRSRGGGRYQPDS
jgi:hypothetical protein